LRRVTEVLDELDEDWREAIYQQLSKNEDKDVRMVTDEEELQRYVNELKFEFEKDIRINLEREQDQHEDMQTKYPKYMARLKLIMSEFGKVNSGFRRIMNMPNFLVGLMMAARVGRHYLHAPWFKVASFNRMVDVHGSVSKAKPQRHKWEMN
jgi:hypothetical protein